MDHAQDASQYHGTQLLRIGEKGSFIFDYYYSEPHSRVILGP